MRPRFVLSVAIMLCAARTTSAQTTAFNYQGKLDLNGLPVDGLIDFTFLIFNAPSGGVQSGGAYVDDQTVEGGLFSSNVPLGILFDGADYWIQISLRDGAIDNANRDPLTYTTLPTRQQVLPAPHALFARNAGKLDGPRFQRLPASHPQSAGPHRQQQRPRHSGAEHGPRRRGRLR